MNTWTYRQQNNKWVVGKWTSERIRITSDGHFIYHNDPIENLQSDLYEFETEWAAKSHAKFCNKLDSAYSGVRWANFREPITFTEPMYASGGLIVSSSVNKFEFRQSENKIVLSVDSKGILKKFDLPYFIGVWFKGTRFGSLLHKFWFGWSK